MTVKMNVSDSFLSEADSGLELKPHMEIRTLGSNQWPAAKCSSLFALCNGETAAWPHLLISIGTRS